MARSWRASSPFAPPFSTSAPCGISTYTARLGPSSARHTSSAKLAGQADSRLAVGRVSKRPRGRGNGARSDRNVMLSPGGRNSTMNGASSLKKISSDGSSSDWLPMCACIRAWPTICASAFLGSPPWYFLLVISAVRLASRSSQVSIGAVPGGASRPAASPRSARRPGHVGRDNQSRVGHLFRRCGVHSAWRSRGVSLMDTRFCAWCVVRPTGSRYKSSASFRIEYDIIPKYPLAAWCPACGQDRRP